MRALFLLFVVVILFAACAGRDAGSSGPPASVAVAQLVRQFPAVAAMVAQATRHPVVTEWDGTAARYTLATAQPKPAAAKSQWHSTSRALSMTVGAAGVMRVGVGSVGGIGVERLGSGGARPAAAAGGVVFGDGTYTRGFLFATEHGMEDLLVAQDATSHVGYRLELPDGWRLHAPKDYPGLIEVRDERDASRMRIRTGKAWDAAGREVSVVARVKGREVTWAVEGDVQWPVVVDPTFEDAGTMVFDHTKHTETLLPSGKVLIVGGTDARGSAEVYDPTTATFAATGGLASPRDSHAATLLRSGKVLITGGNGASAEVYDPATGTFSGIGEMTEARYDHTATLLSSGKVLIAGGVGSNGSTTSAEVYDPATGVFVPTGALAEARASHTATLLPSGKVLFTGGNGTPSAEIYDPATATFATVGAPITSRFAHTATLLPSGQVLIAGGQDDKSVLASTELYDPTTGAFTANGAMTVGRSRHTATLLPSGTVLVTGGTRSDATTEIYAAGTGTFAKMMTMAAARYEHTATVLPSGKVLIAGGTGTSGTTPSAELYDPAAGTIVSVGAMTEARGTHTATLLATGDVLVAGGWCYGTIGYTARSSAEVYDAATGALQATAEMSTARYYHTATRLASGRVLVAGGYDGVVGAAMTSAELYDPATGTFAGTGAMTEARYTHTATLLTSGKVLMVGGGAASAELYDPLTGTFAETGAMSEARGQHSATLLASGKVLVAGGFGTSSETPSAEVYDPVAGAFASTGVMSEARYLATGTLLPSGKVLIAGGNGTWGAPTSAEVYDPATGVFTVTGAMTWPRTSHTATLLPSGNVLIAGGASVPNGATGSAEVYDSATGTFVATGAMRDARYAHTATLLASGRVLVAGGETLLSVPTTLASTELFDPGTGTFSGTRTIPDSFQGYSVTLIGSGKVLLAGGTAASNATAAAGLYDPAAGSVAPTGAMTQPRVLHSATLLPSGKVLIAGGGADPRSAELLDVPSGTFSATGPMGEDRRSHTATLLPSGRVLIAGGVNRFGDTTASAELYDPETGTFAATGTMIQKRVVHTATLLASGKVLIAGGGSDTGTSPAPEVYDPATGQFTASPLSFSAEASATLANGDALLARAGRVAHVGADGTTLAPGVGAPTVVAVVPLADGDAVVVGCYSMFWIPATTRTAGAPRNSPLGVFSAVRLASGELFAFFGGTYRADPRPAGVVAPTITTTPSTIVADSQVVLTGTRFSSPTAVGSSALPADPSHLPLVAFMPAAVTGGGPIFGRTIAWSDTQLTWEVPRTAFRGPGFLHVYVEGVWSDGAYTVLVGQPLASACRLDAECGTDHCVDGVCCDRACAGGCETCLAAAQATGGADGTCKPIAKGGAPRFGCEPIPGESCSATGTCDGVANCTLPAQTQCALPADAGVGLCIAGVCAPVPKATCDATGAVVAPNGDVTPCTPFACRDGACLNRCQGDADCATGVSCTGTHACQACTLDRGGVAVAGATPVSCSPYLCAVGECTSSCESGADCAPGNRCTVDGRCAPAVTPAAAVDACACRAAGVGGPGGGRRAWTLLIAACTAAAARSRRRRAPRRSRQQSASTFGRRDHAR